VGDGWRRRTVSAGVPVERCRGTRCRGLRCRGLRCRRWRVRRLERALSCIVDNRYVSILSTVIDVCVTCATAATQGVRALSPPNEVSRGTVAPPDEPVRRRSCRRPCAGRGTATRSDALATTSRQSQVVARRHSATSVLIPLESRKLTPPRSTSSRAGRYVRRPSSAAACSCPVVSRSTSPTTTIRTRSGGTQCVCTESGWGGPWSKTRDPVIATAFRVRTYIAA